MKRKEIVATNQHLPPSCVKFIAVTVAQTVGVIVPQIAQKGLTNPIEMFRQGQVVPPHHKIATKQTCTCKLKVKNILGKDAHTVVSFIV